MHTLASRPISREITRELAAFAARSRFVALPEIVRRETARAFLNWMGCVFGGSRDPAVAIAAALAAETGGAPQAQVIGHRQRTDMAAAAFLNCLSSSALAFDDTHLATVTHPTGPVAAALFAYCEQHAVSGEEFVNALALGIEIQCRMSNVLLQPPASANLGFYVTGLTGPIGTAVALGRLLGLDEQRMAWAIGLAAAQAAGFRATHGSMAASFVPAHAARSGVSAAMLAAKGFTCSDRALESATGFVGVFSSNADVGHAAEGLGTRFELLSNTYKPYPCGIVIHPAIDACLDIANRLDRDAVIAAAALKVHPLALTLTDRREPKTPLEAQVSLYHWAAAALVRRLAGVPEMQRACIDDPDIAVLRRRIIARSDARLARDQAVAEVELTDGTVLQTRAEHARGSLARPMTDAELDSKFTAQTGPILGPARTARLLHLCRDVSSLRNVGTEIAAIWADRDEPHRWPVRASPGCEQREETQ
jgi:2-methylcitrate dehydratase PrpD